MAWLKQGGGTSGSHGGTDTGASCQVGKMIPNV